MKRLVVLILLLLAGCNPAPNTPSDSQAKYYSLDLPRGTAEARSNQQEIPMLFLTLRLTDESGKRRVLFSEEDETLNIARGETASMAFSATTSFKSAGAFLTSDGRPGTSALVSLNNDKGETLGSQKVDSVEDRTWVELPFPTGSPGKYILEVRNEGNGSVGWRGKRVKSTFAETKEGVLFNDGTVPFQVSSIPQYTNGSWKTPIGARVEALYFLGGTSAYDQGSGWWNDSEAQEDFTEKQFIGDKAGEVRITYTDGTSETVPILFGWNIWWFHPFDNPKDGGPYLEPFASDKTSADILKAALKLSPVELDPLVRYHWAYQPKPIAISTVELIDNPEKRGFPLVSAITVKSNAQVEGARLLPAPLPAKTDAVGPINSDAVNRKSYEAPLEALRRVLYTYEDDVRTDKLPPPSSNARMITFQGPVTATILSRVFADNLADLMLKLEDSGAFHTSGKGSPNYGGYIGIGTWRNGFGLFYDQSWSRDMGRGLLEALRFGRLPKAEMGIKFADSRLHDLPNGFPRINRSGQKVPAHWATVLQDPLYMDTDRQGDGNQENDGHGLLLLAHYRAWEQKGRDLNWLKDRWPFIADATEWYVFQMDNPSFSRFAGVLYTESESANEKGYDVYSNFIALKALEKSAVMAEAQGDGIFAEKWKSYAQKLRQGILAKLTEDDPRFGKTWKATAWNWTYAHESLAPAFILADTDSYGTGDADNELLEITRNTLARQLSLPGGASAPRILGYGQGFLTQAALMLDEVESYSQALANMAKYIYAPRFAPYLVPEGVITHPSGKFWYRDGDLGNAAQQAEVIKTLGLVAGIDNNSPDILRLVPRLPEGWTGISIADYPLPHVQTQLSYELTRKEREIQFQFTSGNQIPTVQVRLGPIPADARPVMKINGAETPPAKIETIGKWQWIWTAEMERLSYGEVAVSW